MVVLRINAGSASGGNDAILIQLLTAVNGPSHVILQTKRSVPFGPATVLKKPAISSSLVIAPAPCCRSQFTARAQ